MLATKIMQINLIFFLACTNFACCKIFLLMKTKYSRLSAIRVILAGQRISSQEELLKQLLSIGYECTQATLSRDLKELEVSKEVIMSGECIYVLPDSPLRSQDSRSCGVPLNGGVTSVAFSANVAVIKTRPGYASGIAQDIDYNGFESVLGTVAGYDTIHLVVKEGYTKDDVLIQLRRIIPEIDSLKKL